MVGFFDAMRLSLFSQILALGSLASFSRWIWRLTVPGLAEEPDCQGSKKNKLLPRASPLTRRFGASLTACWIIFSQDMA